MKLVAGLGNPGKKYAGTRHNVGFDVVTELARRLKAPTARAAFDGLVTEVTHAGEKVLLLAPQTFMNRSGQSVQKARDFYKLELTDLLLVCDDFNLPLARLRMRTKGSAGGQKGLADTIRALGTEEFARLRVGVGEPPSTWDAADWVLSRFSRDERPEIDVTIVQAADAILEWVAAGPGPCMNRYN